MIQEKLDPACLAPMDIFAEDAPLRINLAYAGPDCFCGPVYRPEARLWLQEDLAAVTLLAARLAHDRHDVRLVVYDGLRTVEAQALMLQCPAVKAHPHWIEGEDRVLSPPGAGGHPRGMAVDVSLETRDSVLLDMGTAFDEFPEGGGGPAENRAHRAFADLPDDVKRNRKILEDAMTDAAHRLGLNLLPLPVEWWDFRFPRDVVSRYAALSDADLPPQMQMTGQMKNSLPDFPAEHFERIKNKILKRTEAAQNER